MASSQIANGGEVDKASPPCYTVGMFSSWNIPPGASKSQLCAIIELVAPDLEVEWSTGLADKSYTVNMVDRPIATVLHNGVRTMVSAVGTKMTLPDHLQPGADDGLR